MAQTEGTGGGGGLSTPSYANWLKNLRTTMPNVLGPPPPPKKITPPRDRFDTEDIPKPLLPPGPPLLTSLPGAAGTPAETMTLMGNVMETGTMPGWLQSIQEAAPPPPPNEEFSLVAPTLKELPPEGQTYEDRQLAMRMSMPGWDRMSLEQQRAIMEASFARNDEESQAYIDQLNYAIQGGHLADELYQGYFYNPTTGEQQRLPDDVIQAVRDAGAMPSVMRLDYQSQYRNWLDTLNAFLGIERETPMDAYMAELQKEWGLYNQGLPEEPAQDWYSDYSGWDGGGGGGGGGGGYEYTPQFWLNRVKWNI